MNLKIIGFDPGLNHGGAVYCYFQIIDNQLVLLDFARVLKFNKKSSISLNIESSVGEIAEFAGYFRDCIKQTTRLGNLLGVRIFSDFDQSSVHWRTQKRQVVKLAQLMGYLQRSLHEMGIVTASVSPSDIRKWLNLGASSPKEDVHKSFIEYIKIHGDERSQDIAISLQGLKEDPDYDLLDAFILAYFGATVSFASFLEGMLNGRGDIQ